MAFLGGLLGGAGGAGAAGGGAGSALAPQVAPGIIQMAPGLAGPTMGAYDAVSAGLGQSGALGSGWGLGGLRGLTQNPFPAGSQLLYPGGSPETSLPLGGISQDILARSGLAGGGALPGQGGQWWNALGFTERPSFGQLAKYMMFRQMGIQPDQQDIMRQLLAALTQQRLSQGGGY